MKQLFKLKREARPFFDKKFMNTIMTLESWSKNGIHENALQEVEKIYLSYGHQEIDCVTHLRGWSGFAPKDQAKFFFTINVADINNSEYESVKDENISELMDRMQLVIKDFIAEKSLF